MRKLSVYIHIPFCERKCFYCDFLSFPAGEDQKERYMAALLSELQREAVRYRDYTVDTVFIGGGTPSVLKGEWIERVLNKLKEQFAFSQNPEITMEVNPGSADAGKLSRWRSAGVNRLSIGTQSVHEEELRALGRIHDAAAFYETYRLAKKEGFAHINVDLISAIPGQTCASWQDTLYAVTELSPEHISAYSLILEEGTAFYEWYGGKKNPHAAVLPSEEEERRMDEDTGRVLKKSGYERYEISNYARSGARCRHNLAYWKRDDYAGFGLGASSMVENVRWKNTESFESYVNHASSADIRGEIQTLSVREQMEEFMFLGLRLTEGVDRKEFACLFGKTLEDSYGGVLPKLYADGLLEGEERVRLTPYGRDIANYVMAQFLF